MAEKGIKVSQTAVYNLLTKFRKLESIGDIKRRPRSRRLSKEHYRFMDELMAENPDLTSRQLYSAFKEAYQTTEASYPQWRELEDIWDGLQSALDNVNWLVMSTKKSRWSGVIAGDLDLDDVI